MNRRLISYVICRYVFACKDWLKVQSRMSKRSAKVLTLESVEESHLSAAKSKYWCSVGIIVFMSNSCCIWHIFRVGLNGEWCTKDKSNSSGLWWNSRETSEKDDIIWGCVCRVVKSVCSSNALVTRKCGNWADNVRRRSRVNNRAKRLC